MNRVAIITSNIGDFDEIHKIPQQTVPFDYFYCKKVEGYKEFTASTSNRMKSKYPKCQGHKLFKNHILIWIDGSITITSDKFVENMVANLERNMMVSPLHPDRKNVYDELNFVLNCFDTGVPYVTSRYDKEKIQEELDFITEKKMDIDYPLYNAGVCARWNNPRINAAFDEWWKLILKYSELDQALFNYICWKNELKIHATNWETGLFTIHSHIK
jgi:hypothetical protein